MGKPSANGNFGALMESYGCTCVALFVLTESKGVYMKPIIGWTLAVAALLGTVPLTASAQHHHGGWHGDIRVFEVRDLHHWHSGAWRHSWHGGRLGWWWVVGGAWYFYPEPVYPYPDPYRPPVVVVEQAPPVVVQQAPAPVQVVPVQPPAAVPAAPQFWYYCEAAKGYYPYVASCPSGWKTVPAAPSGVPK